MNISDDTKAIMAAIFHANGISPKEAWHDVAGLLAAAPKVKDPDRNVLESSLDKEHVVVQKDGHFCALCEAKSQIHPAVIARMKGLEEIVRAQDDAGLLRRIHEGVYLTLPPLPPGWDKPRVEPTEPTNIEWSMAVGNLPWHDKFDTVGAYCKAVAAEVQRLAQQRAERGEQP